jgi:hypothetical protein
MRLCQRVLVVAALSLPLLAPAARATCGAEGCPFVRDAFGVPSGRFAFDLRYQEVTQDALWNGSHEVALADVISQADVHGEVELFTRTKSWVAEARMRVSPDLTITATLPYMDRVHRHWIRHSYGFNPQYVHVWNIQGLGDATVLGQYRVLHRQGWPAITLQGGVKLPTGRRHIPDETQVDQIGPEEFETTLEPSARPGTGSTDWITGAAFAQTLPWSHALPLSATVLARWTTKGTDDFRVGNEVQVALSGGVVPWEWLTIFGQANLSAHGSEVSAEESEVAHSGMRALYLTPGLTARVARGVSLYGLYQVRAWGETDEATVVGKSHFMFGTTYSFGQ